MPLCELQSGGKPEAGTGPQPLAAQHRWKTALLYWLCGGLLGAHSLYMGDLRGAARYWLMSFVTTSTLICAAMLTMSMPGATVTLVVCGIGVAMGCALIAYWVGDLIRLRLRLRSYEQAVKAQDPCSTLCVNGYFNCAHRKEKE
ncbi:hypothetical protein HNQ50_002567 [Silvimonas terrae]|uniref:TM2 domain-containing protein n=1 Tax=Silvimonas terrae TaxID=300266 RepID=A0A840RFM4_9NEIS|nr:hypothetical protein [Silvimonas terrae]MBB5191837.1 hypothetical protein [Silvimonas terrae]